MKGRLKDRSAYWKEVLGASQFVFEVISQGYRLPFVTMPEAKAMPNQKSAFDHNEFVSRAVSEL